MFSATAFAGGHTVDGTFVCTSTDMGGVNLFKVEGDAGEVSVWANPLPILAPSKLPQEVGYHATQAQLRDDKLHFEPQNCAPAGRTIPLAPRGVPLKSRVSNIPDGVNCWVTRAYFRERVTFDARNRPIRATFAMANARTGKPLAFIVAAPPHLTVYAAAACRHD